MKEAFLFLVLIFTIAMLGSLFSDEKEKCNRKGGALVRGVIGMECVAGFGVTK